MASVEQKGLAEDVKSVHRKLREQLLEGGEPNEVILISITGTSYFAFYEGLGETYARSGDFGQVQQKHEIFGNILLGKERRGEQGGMGQESGIIQVSLSPGQDSKYYKLGLSGSRNRYYSSILVTCPDISSLIQVESYFWANGEEREKKRDQKRLIRSQDNNREGEVIVTGLLDKSPDLLNRTVVEAKSENTPLQVLDVGSCYNPFGEFENWQV